MQHHLHTCSRDARPSARKCKWWENLEAFYALQRLASGAPILKLASWEEPFEVINDASDIAIRAILLQDSKPGAYFSKKLDSAQCNFSVYEKELFAIISALKHWKHFLYGREFTLKTNCQALKWLQIMPSADWSDRRARWSQIFQQFRGMIEYVPGKHNPVADALSQKSCLVEAIQPTTILEIRGMDLDSMKAEYPDSVNLSTPYSLAMASKPTLHPSRRLALIQGSIVPHNRTTSSSSS